MKKRLVIKNASVILPDKIIKKGYVICEEGIITQVEEGLYGGEDNLEVIDANGYYLSPGFIDIHTHGAGGYDFMDNTVEAYLGASRTHARYGTTALVPTTLTGTMEELFHTFDIFKEAEKQNDKGAILLGLHLEGPYLAYSQRGAQDPKYLRNPEPKEYMEILNASDRIIRWSMAPELEGALALGKILHERNILASIGHSDAIYEEVVKAFHAGFTHITHLYSCMSSITRRNAYRYAGVLEAAYLLDDMTVEIIADGIHIPKPLLQYVCKFKPHSKIALCTDSMRAAGMPDGEYLLGSKEKGQTVVVEDGVAKLPDRTAFAGSVATADRLVRTMVEVAELPLLEAIRMITANPASILHIENRKGAVMKGMDADLVIFNDQIQVQTTIVKGNVVYSQDKN